jgi:hypothetical protein
MRILQIAVLACTAVAAVACSSSSNNAGGAPDAGGSGDSGPAPTFTQVYADVLGPSCGNACHNPSGIGVSMGHLDMSTQSAAFTNLNMAAQGIACSGNALPRVTPGNGDMSLVYLKVSLDDPTPCGGHMPLGLPNLPQAKTEEIKSWINAGAMNN